MSKWTPFEMLWASVFLLTGGGITAYSQGSLMNYAVLITGIACVLLAAKGHIFTYVFGVVNSILYAYTAYNNQLFGEVGLNLLFYVPTNIIGFFMWQKHLGECGVIMKRMSLSAAIQTYGVCVVAIGALGWLLSLIPTQNTPYIDASTNMIGIIATLLMMFRYREQWMLYIVLNILTIIMWSIRLVNGSDDGAIMLVMWGAFLINAVYGYYNWTKQSALTTKEADYA